MGLFGSLGKSISKGAAAGSHTLGPIGGLLGAVGGAAQGIFGGSTGLLGQQSDPNDITVTHGGSLPMFGRTAPPPEDDLARRLGRLSQFYRMNQRGPL